MNSSKNNFAVFLYRAPQTIAQFFSGYNIAWQVVAVIITYVSVVTGFDWMYFIYFRPTFLYAWFFPAVIIGFSVPIILPLILLLIAKIKKDSRMLNTGFALGQAGILAVLFSGFYKFFTGRLHPQQGQITAIPFSDLSRTFRFGFYRGGVFWGWPSSHTSVAFALSATLIILYPKNKTVVSLAVLYALYVGLGVSITVHWFSDFAAGVIFGIIVGVAVGKSFRQRYEMDAKQQQ